MRRPSRWAIWAVLVAGLGIPLVAFGIAPLVVFTILGYRSFTIEAGSMKPTLLVGDVVVAAPFTGQPERGDVVVFEHPRDGSYYVKRILALPGEQVALQAGQVIIDNEAVPRRRVEDFVEPFERERGALPMCENAPEPGGECRKPAWVERLPEGRDIAVLNMSRRIPSDDLSSDQIPGAHVFVLGDNRDNSVDSRHQIAWGGIGYVPLDKIAYRVRFVWLSRRNQAPWLALDRILKRVE